ncbi:sigma-70 family RNA polymerase sigma factor [Streptomyces halstedii]|uniref:RNA polymerase sigma factor n=1 Tax=Streptomyces halstedii TaxID=1944 RepID=UPI003254D1B2
METFQTASNRERAERFRAIYADEYPRIVAFAYRRVGDRAVAEDLAAETLGVAWERMADGNGITAGWLYTTARNLLSNHYRATARLGELHRRVADDSYRSTSSEEQHVVLDVLDRLSAPHREVLLLSYWDGLSAAEVGEVLGCTGPAVWVRLHRARKAFRLLYTSTKESS